MTGHNHDTSFYDGCGNIFQTTFGVVPPSGGGSVDPEYIKGVVKEYLDQNSPYVRKTHVTLFADKWVENEGGFSQVVDVEGVTPNSVLSISFSENQLKAFHAKDLTFVAGNKNGVVTVYITGQKPQNDYEMQVTMKEVV